MTSAAANYHESTQFIHQRYEDTAHIIFQQQQKARQDEKRRQQQAKTFHYSSPVQHKPTNQQSEFSRYGNRPVVATETEKPAKTETGMPNKATGIEQSQPAVKSSVCILT